MLRTLFTIGFIALIGLVAFKVVFGLLGPLVGLLLWLLGIAFQLALVGLLIYVIVRIVSPATAERMKAAMKRGTGA